MILPREYVAIFSHDAKSDKMMAEQNDGIPV